MSSGETKTQEREQSTVVGNSRFPVGSTVEYDRRYCRPAEPTNYVEKSGTVVRVNKRSVTVRTASGQQVRVPKSRILSHP